MAQLNHKYYIFMLIRWNNIFQFNLRFSFDVIIINYNLLILLKIN